MTIYGLLSPVSLVSLLEMAFTMLCLFRKISGGMITFSFLPKYSGTFIFPWKDIIFYYFFYESYINVEAFSFLASRSHCQGPGETLARDITCMSSLNRIIRLEK